MKNYEFKGKEYPVITLTIWGKDYDISTESFSKVLMDEEGSEPVDEEARIIDEGIYFYAPDEMVKEEKVEELKEYVIQESFDPYDMPKFYYNIRTVMADTAEEAQEKVENEEFMDSHELCDEIITADQLNERIKPFTKKQKMPELSNEGKIAMVEAVLKLHSNGIDWGMLMDQKSALLQTIGELEKAGNEENALHLTGILHLLDSFQDYGSTTEEMHRFIFGL